MNKQLAMLREAVEQVLPLVLQRALDGDTDAQKLILERGLPRFKQIEFSLVDKTEKPPQTSPPAFMNAYLRQVVGE